MAHITLAVTTRVIQEVNAGNSYQRQITIKDASPELRTAFDTATKDNRVVVAVNGVFELSVGDTDAMWAVHQREGLQTEDFTSLYDLLA